MTGQGLADALHLHSIVDDGVDDHGERWFGCRCGETLRGAGRASELFGAHLAAALADAGYVVVRAEDVELRAAAKWLTDIWADNVAIERGSALWEDIQRLRAAVETE